MNVAQAARPSPDPARMVPPPSPQTGPQDAQRLLRCAACGRTDEVSATDLLRYTKAGWPRCCGEVMALYLQADKPGPDDTTPETAALP